MLNLGRMRERVRIEQRSGVQDASGEREDTWNLIATKRAEVVRSTGREPFAAEQRQGRVPTVFRLRWLEGVLPEMRLVCNSKVYNIESAVDPDGMRHELLVTTVEHVEEAG